MAVVLINKTAQKQLENLPRVIQKRVRNIFVQLEEWPAVSGAKALRGKRAGCFRKRTGDYRIIFRIARDTIYIEQIGHRKNVYKE